MVSSAIRTTPATASIAFPLGEQVHGIPMAVGVDGLTERIVQRKAELTEACLESVARFKLHSHKSEDSALISQLPESPL